ncbi:MAG: hypothetical protein GY858_06260 [Candidatus Omnitrophica bacterium]|nr:hypothetical protein [Candidatus Omnitrophota bacterium]
MKKMLVPFILVVLFNLILIFVGGRFLFGISPKIVLNASIVFLSVGLVGVAVIIICTSKLKNILKTVLVLLVLAGCCGYGYIYFRENENVIEHYCAIAVVGMEEDVKFAEYWFFDETELLKFLSQISWYQDLRERKNMLTYYYSVKAEEEELGEEIIDRKYFKYAPSGKMGGGLIAYINEYRSGPFAFETNPKYIMSASGE